MPTDREMSEFLLRACHDLRTPMRAIRAHTELLQKRAGDPGPSLDFIVQGARKLDGLVDGIAAYANAMQVDSASFMPIKLGIVLRSALAKLQPAIAQAGAEVTYDELPRVKGNPDRLAFVFEELIRNALQHPAAESPRIHIAGDSTGTVTVHDNGKGVEESELEGIFRPFQKLDGEGAGIGLAVCRAIVESHGGKIHAQCPSTGGFSVIFVLPPL
jgi:signal transduction histidine kinase